MYFSPLAIAPALAVTGLATAGFAEPTARECEDAAKAVAEMLNPSDGASFRGVGWVLRPPAVDYSTLDDANRWRQVATHLALNAATLVSGSNLLPPLVQEGAWAEDVKPSDRLYFAQAFMRLDTLEQCLRPLALTQSPAIGAEIAELDSKFPLDQRASLRPLMEASQ
jgi:hypothetical protein